MRYHCHQCSFVTTSIPNLRRHCTAQHHTSQHRTAPLTILNMALRGRPQCNHCHKLFTSWRRFKIHVERNCCQVEVRPTPPPARTATVHKAEADDFHVTHAAFWPVLAQLTQTQQWTAVQQHEDIGAYLTDTCMVCGIWNNKCQEMHCHYRLRHEALVPGIFVKSAQITKQLPTESPCALCKKPFKRGHTCTVATQLAALVLHGMDTPGDTLRCDLCETDFATMALLHAHLHDEHEVPVHDWNVARDGCSDCGQTYATRAGLRRHVTDGRCPYFDPNASSAPLPAARKWELVLTSGALSRDGLTAHQRLQLTLHCQLCGEFYQRSTDLSAHLQQTHGALWKQAGEMVRFLLQTLISRTGCLCNPSVNDRSRTHICNLVYQVAMIFHTSELEVLVPWCYSEAEVRLATKAWLPRPQHQLLLNVLMDRDFSHLWHAPNLLKLFRNWCICCGGWYNTAELISHQLRHHHSDCQWAAQIKFQILQCMKAEMQQDYQCHFCRLIFNLQPHDGSDQTERLGLVQIHLASNCPVLQQITLLLLPTHGRDSND